MLYYSVFDPFATLEPIISITDLEKLLLVFAIGEDGDAGKVILVVGIKFFVVGYFADMVQPSFLYVFDVLLVFVFFWNFRGVVILT